MSKYNISRPKAAEILWVSLRTIDRYALNWKLKYKKLRGRVLFSAWDLDEIKIENSTDFVQPQIKKEDFWQNDTWRFSWFTKEEKTEEPPMHIFNSWEQKISFNFDIIDFVKARTEREVYKNAYDDTKTELKQKQSEIEKLNFRLWELIARQNTPLIENEQNKIIIKTLQDKTEENEDLISKLKQEISFQKIVKKIFIGLLLTTILLMSFWYFYNFKM